MTPTVQWEERSPAQVTLACGGESASSAADRAKEIIQRNAERMAHMYVQDVDVAPPTVLPGP